MWLRDYVKLFISVRISIIMQLIVCKACYAGWIIFICSRYSMAGEHPIFFNYIQQFVLTQESWFFITYTNSLFQQQAESGFYVAYSEDSGCILRLSSAFWLEFMMSKVLSSFHGLIFIWLGLIIWIFSFSCKMHAWHIYHYPTILHLISSLLVYLTSLLMLIWALQTIYSNLHLINAKYVQNPILWVTVCLLYGFFFQTVGSGIMLLLQ